MKILPEDAPGDEWMAVLRAARNESESFQMALRDDEEAVLGVDAVVSNLWGPPGSVIPRENVRLYREHLVEVTIPSFRFGVVGNPRWVGEYPDPLVPFRDPYDPTHPPVGAPFDVPVGRSLAIWVEVEAPADAAPGIYVGALTVTSENQGPTVVPILLQVWDIAIPAERRVATSYGFSHNLVLDYHGGPDGRWDEESQRILQRYEDELHGHRVDTTRLHYGVSTPFRFDENGELLPVDWSAYDAAVGPRLSGEYYSDGIGPARFNAGFFCPGRRGGLEESLTDEQYQACAAAFAAHLVEMGWMDRAYIYVRDEPFLEPISYLRIAEDIALMVEADPAWEGRFLCTSFYTDLLAGSIGIWCPDTIYYDEWYLGWLGIRFYGREEFPERFALGEELWFYVCNANMPPYAGYDIDSLYAYEPRMLMWQSWYEGATGFLYWRTNYWQREDPWGTLIDPVTFPIIARNGDGFLLYPGDHDGTAAPAGSPEEIALDGPVGTVRLKATRDGLEDWELLDGVSS
jgi:hypothetical protein